MGALDGGDEIGYTDSELPAAMKKGTAMNGSYDQEQQTGDAASGGHSSSSVKSFLKKTIWHGGSVYDAWLNAVAAQVSPWKQSTTTTTTQVLNFLPAQFRLQFQLLVSRIESRPTPHSNKNLHFFFYNLSEISSV